MMLLKSERSDIGIYNCRIGEWIRTGKFLDVFCMTKIPGYTDRLDRSYERKKCQRERGKPSNRLLIVEKNVKFTREEVFGGMGEIGDGD